MFASQVFQNIGVFPFGKMKAVATIQYQGCYERAVSPSERRKKLVHIMNLKIRLPNKQFIKTGSAVFLQKDLPLFLTLEV